MCGIFAYFQKGDFTPENLEKIQKSFMTISHRGPDHSSHLILKNKGFSIFLGFHRLAIVDLSPQTNEILNDSGVYLLCNGEIYNYKDLIKRYILEPKTGSDCEVILQFYRKYPDRFFHFIKELDGTFAFVLYDDNKGLVFCSRDKIGVRPLFQNTCGDSLFAFASEAKALDFKHVEQFKPGTFFEMSFIHDWKRKNNAYPEWNILYNTNYIASGKIIKELFIEAVRKRLPADRPIGFLLSGGLDSSLVASVANKILKEDFNNCITTFSIGFENSPDILAARKVADFLNSNHHEIIINSNDILETLPNVIYHLETFDVTTIRASIPMYLISKYIKENTDIKVVFSGEISDELFGGYLYFHKAPSPRDLQKETIRLLDELAWYDVLRGDRTVSAWGLEIRTPFVDGDLLNFVTCINPEYKMPNPMEKMLLRDAFKGYLPEDILYRRKEAFSDGISSASVESLKKYASKNKEIFKDITIDPDYQIPETDEEKMYYSIFQRYYKDKKGLYIKKYWLPRWCGDVKDPSATILDIYKKS